MNASRILYVHNHLSEFVRLDRELLSQAFEVHEVCIDGLVRGAVNVAREIRRCDVVVCWFASAHAVPAMLASLACKMPMILIIGGYDIANISEIGYGHQRGGATRVVSSWLTREATLLITNSHYSKREALANIGGLANKLRVVYHGIPDRWSASVKRNPGARVLTVGQVNCSNLLRKGLSVVADTSRLLPDVEFVIAGRCDAEASEVMRTRGGPNLCLTGFVSREMLTDLYRSSHVYVQPSRHEGFGLSVAEAMLSGCIPVVSGAGALPEVAGPSGITVRSYAAKDWAKAVAAALSLGTQERSKARTHVLTKFSMESRFAGLAEAVQDCVAC